MGWLQPKKRKRRSRLAASKLAQATGVAILLSQPAKFINTLIGLMIVGILALSSLSPFVQVAGAAPDSFYLHDVTAGVALREVETGGSSASTTVATAANLTAAHNQLYLAAISTNANIAVSSVSGLGLTWTLVLAQCSVSAETRVEVWKSLGTTTVDAAVSATLASAPDNAAIAVSRYSGVDTASPIGDTASTNTKNGACNNGGGSSSYTVDLTTTAANSWAYGAVAMQDKTHTPGTGYTERADFRQGSSNEAGLAVEDRLVAAASTVAVDGSLSANVRWALVAVEIKALSISPGGKAMNTTVGTGGTTLSFDTVNQNEYWYAEETWPLGDDNGTIAAGAYNLNMYFNSLPGGASPPQAETVSTGDTRPASLTISHTTGSGSDRLMLVGISLVNDELETISSVTYNGTGLDPEGSVANGDDARVEIWSLIAPPSGTHDVVITFSAPLQRAAVVGVMTFTGVHQTTPLGTFVSNTGSPVSSGPTVDVTSAADELVFDTAACETCTSFTVGADQTQRWNISEPSGYGPTLGAGSTEPGAGTVTMSWSQGSDDHWAIGAVPIKPSGGSAPAGEGSGASGSTQRTSISVSHTASGAERLMLVGVGMHHFNSETVSTVTYNGASLSPVGAVNSGTDTRVEIWRLIAPATGTHDVVITFSASLRYGAKAGTMTFTNVDQTTPLGTFAPNSGNSAGPATVDVTSASDELVFDTVSCRSCISLTVGAAQDERWNLDTLGSGSASNQTLAAASTEPGSGTVTMSWTLGATNDWAIGAVPIKPGTASAAVEIVVSVHHTASNGSGETLIVQSPTTTIDSSTSNPLNLSIDTGALQTFTSGSPRRMRLKINVTAITGGASFVLAYDGSCGSNQCSNLATPAVVVPEYGWVIFPLAVTLPPLMLWMKRRRRLKSLEVPIHE